MNIFNRLFIELKGGNRMIEISRIQKVALQRLLRLSGVVYEKIVKEALYQVYLPDHITIPTIDNLSYEEALCVVKYGNAKFNISLVKRIPT